ncbi:DUF4082 domain-containing protein [Paenarthrobacter sp. NPDC089675]|uniref:DUF4082 domain-containing protein n=1 Tax=Paenarthrobacter sp. NPDC089675 TaxID=3364376 RepID=UPI0037F1B5E5
MPGPSASRPQRFFKGIFAPLVVAMVASLLPFTAPAAVAADPCNPVVNPVVCENSKPGSPPSEWDITGAGDDSIQGFSTAISVNAGQPIQFKVDTSASTYTIDIYRSGWYGGNGARKVASVTPSAFRQNQPACRSDQATELYDCGTWAVSATWQVPATAVSGVYFALLTRPDTGGQSHITFIVRNDGNRSSVIFQTSDTTWQAYNTYGGADFYQGAVNGRAYKISYNRPMASRSGPDGRDFYFANEYPLVRFLEQNGYDVSYISGLDTDTRGAELLNHKVFLSVGHDEYVSGNQRANITAARDAGVNLQFLSGNEMYWRTRFEASSVDGTAGRTLTCYKETWSNAKIDPSTQWTGTWRDPRFASQANGGGLPENGLTGTLYMSNFTDLPVTVSAEEGKTRLWRNTSLTSMAAGTKTALAAHTIGYESDEDIDNGFRPAGLIRLSTTTGAVSEYLQDFGSTVKAGTTTHNITLYKAASGALVFSAGSVQWTWGLDQEHDGNGAPADVRMRQAQVNLLADMGAQPATLAAGLVATTASADKTGPTVAINAPANGATIAQGANVTVSGTATDVGGVVAGVEVSTDGGATWHPATGKSTWTYTYTQKGLATATVQVRAIDDSANIGAVATRNLTLNGPYTVFGQAVPSVVDSGDGGAYEMGLRFTPSVDGFVTGARFYKSTANTGTHIGSLWNAAGTRIATATFANETASGWQSVLFSQPVPVTAGQKYTVSYWAPKGHYATKDYQWAYTGFNDAPMKVAGGFGAEPAGVYSTSQGLPTSSFNGGNYFVDAIFSTVDNSPLTVSNQTPIPSSSSVSIATTVSGVFSKPVTASSVQLTLRSAAGAVAGTTNYDATARKATFTPSAPLAYSTQYTATLAATDSVGGQVTSGGTWTFTTAATAPAPGACPCSLYDDSVTPGIAEIQDGVPLTLGVRFTSVSAGTVNGVRFYKSAGNTGPHTGSLYTAAGQLLATVTFANESSAGWQTAMFSQPVQMAANTEYIAAYKSLTGAYSATNNGFGTGMSVGPLRTVSDAGAYSYSTDFPSSRSTASYLVDVVVMVSAPPFTVGSQNPVAGASSVPLSTTVSGVLSEAAVASSVKLDVKTSSGTAVAGTSAYDQTSRKVTFTPAAALAQGTSYTATVTATSVSGTPLTTGSTWTFTTVPAPRTPGVCPCTLYQDTETPTTAEVNDGVPVALGVRFSSDTAGQISGIRFYKSSGNTGTHTGALYTLAGQQLATVTFTNESSMGWQTATFSQPVTIQADTEYIAAYKTPTGKYSYSSGAFGDGFASGPLHVVTDSGAYSYSSDFPGTASTASYLVDVVFNQPSQPLSVTAQVPAPGATAIPTDVKPSITFSTAVNPGVTFTLTANGSSIAGTAALSADSRTVTFTPAAALPASTVVTANVSNIASPQGQTLPPSTWQFTTATATVQQSTIFGSLAPQVAASTDTKSVELGTAFTVSQTGNVTGIRFYKGTGNTGTHVGSLWNSAGTRLAQVTFTNETATGWQTATLSTPVALSTGQTYVVSYRAPNGRYSYTQGFFNTTWTSGVFTAAGPNNGLYRYGTGGVMPNSSWNATNYFVDVVYATGGQTQAPAPTQTATPTPSATATPTATATATATPSASPSPTPTQSGGVLCGLLGLC